MKLFSRLAAGILGLTIAFGGSAQAAENSTTTEVPKIEKRVAINSASRLMTFYENGVKVAQYPLGLGKTWTPTPVGYFKIMSKEINPPWIDPSDPEYEVPSGPDNPLGYRWMQIYGNYGIHGTNHPESIGGYVSNGCVRMLEADVEKIFDSVEVGTPVDITYNRVVVEKTADGNVVYFIYPDGYGWQSIDVDYVNRWLEPYGVAPFESDANIEEKINLSDGMPTYIGKPYNIEVNGKRIKDVEVNGQKFLAKGVLRDNVSYLPVVPIAMALKTRLEWRAGEGTLKTVYGTVTGLESKSQIYCNADDAIILFNLDGGLQNVTDKSDEGKVYKFYVANSKAAKKARKDKSTGKDTIKIFDDNTPADDAKLNEDKAAERQAELERRKADAEKRKAEIEERRKAAEEKRKANAEKRKAELEERKKAAESKRKSNAESKKSSSSKSTTSKSSGSKKSTEKKPLERRTIITDKKRPSELLKELEEMKVEENATVYDN